VSEIKQSRRPILRLLLKDPEKLNSRESALLMDSNVSIGVYLGHEYRDSGVHPKTALSELGYLRRTRRVIDEKEEREARAVVLSVPPAPAPGIDVTSTLLRELLKNFRVNEVAQWLLASMDSPLGSGRISVTHSPLKARKRLNADSRMWTVSRSGKYLHPRSPEKLAKLLRLRRVRSRTANVFVPREILSITNRKELKAKLVELAIVGLWRGRPMTVAAIASAFGVCKRTVRYWAKYWSIEHTWTKIADLSGLPLSGKLKAYYSASANDPAIRLSFCSSKLFRQGPNRHTRKVELMYRYSQKKRINRALTSDSTTDENAGVSRGPKGSNNLGICTSTKSSCSLSTSIQLEEEVSRVQKRAGERLGAVGRLV